MLLFIILYAIVLIAIGVYDSFKIKTFEDYAVAGKNQKYIFVVLSLMATMIGASATIGLVDRVNVIGFPAFWWLGVGAIGLVLQSVFLSKKIRALDANTLPDIAMKTVGSGGKTLLAVIIAVSWIGIIAAQFIAMSSILSFAIGIQNNRKLIVIIAIAVILYTIIGGQLSVIKTDGIQAVLILTGFIGTFIYLFFISDSNIKPIFDNIELLNNDFKLIDLINLFFITGGAYFLGPDIISRNLVSKDGATAKKSAVTAGAHLVIFAVIITLIGMWAHYNVSDFGGMNPLVYIMSECIPKPLAIMLCLGLISSLLSSADTCIINAASIVEHDIFKRDKVNEIRIIVGIIGTAALSIALFKSDIISLLMASYSIYVPGIVCPLFIAIWFHKKRKVKKAIWYSAVVIGGGLGILNSYFGIGFEFLPLVGMGISEILSVISVVAGDKQETKNLSS